MVNIISIAGYTCHWVINIGYKTVLKIYYYLKGDIIICFQHKSVFPYLFLFAEYDQWNDNSNGDFII